MELEKKLKTLQMYHAAALADSTIRYGNTGILDIVTKQKHNEQINAGAALAERFGVKVPWQAFEKTQELYGCANWSHEDTDTGFIAICTNCMLCTISKKLGSYSPCQIHCLSPIEAMIKAIAPDSDIITDKTLWSAEKCLIQVVYKK